jgi:tRNA A-37 threonylcarbamoyl transferase component Bud32
VELIGQGGMATVYKAYQPAVDRYVAVKILPHTLQQDPAFAQRFEQEARLIAHLEHPHILPVFDFGVSGDYSYIAMRYLSGGSLKELIALHGPMPLARAAQLFYQVADALDYAHSQGVVHRDVKPSNVLLDQRGEAFLSDFGIAKIVAGSAQVTGTAIIGTPAYMSPEQAMGTHLDGRSDVYALGVLLYELLAGRVPFDAETPMSVILKHLHEPVPTGLEARRPDLPPRLMQLVRRMLAKDRAQRFATAGEVAQEVAALGATTTAGALPVRPTAGDAGRRVASTTASPRPRCPHALRRPWKRKGAQAPERPGGSRAWGAGCSRRCWRWWAWPPWRPSCCSRSPACWADRARSYRRARPAAPRSRRARRAWARAAGPIRRRQPRARAGRAGRRCGPRARHWCVGTRRPAPPACSPRGRSAGQRPRGRARGARRHAVARSERARVIALDPQNPAAARLYTTADGLGSADVTRLYEDADGTLWALARGRGAVNRFTGEGWTTVALPETAGEVPAIRAAYREPDGTLWLATTGAGLVRVRETAVRTFTRADGLPGDEVTALLPAGEDAWWIGTSGGAVRLIRDKVTPVGNAALATAPVGAILRDATGALWFGTGGGLYRLDSTSGEWSVAGVEQGLPNAQVVALAEVQWKAGAVSCGPRPATDWRTRTARWVARLVTGARRRSIAWCRSCPGARNCSCAARTVTGSCACNSPRRGYRQRADTGRTEATRRCRRGERAAHHRVGCRAGWHAVPGHCPGAAPRPRRGGAGAWPACRSRPT